MGSRDASRQRADAVLGVTDPRTWRAADWVADIAPHLSYAVVAAGTLKAFEAVR
jgi:hypothetical protein